MEEPSPRSSRFALAGALLVMVIGGGAGFLLGRNTAERTQPVVAGPTAKPQPKSIPSQKFRSVLGRSDFIALAARVADATAAGRDPRPEVSKVDGRRFELRLPFGCGGPASEESEAAMHWRYDAEDQALRIRVNPVTWRGPDWWPEIAAEGIETIEGFWVTRPWTSSEACPAEEDPTVAIGTDPVTLPGQTLAVGQIFFTGGARGGRRNGEPYESTVRVPEDELEASDGFRLRISGRIAGIRGYGPIHCRQPASSQQRPICLVSVVIDEIAIENPISNKAVATWSIDSRNMPET